jgi:hypothetical protein
MKERPRGSSATRSWRGPRPLHGAPRGEPLPAADLSPRVLGDGLGAALGEVEQKLPPLAEDSSRSSRCHGSWQDDTLARVREGLNRVRGTARNGRLWTCCSNHVLARSHESNHNRGSNRIVGSLFYLSVRLVLDFSSS